jgi:nitrogen PTS system EIIA component
MKLSELISPSCILTDLKGTDSSSVIRELGLLMAHLEKFKYPEVLINALIERETLSSTAIGHGIALPHAKIEGLGDLSCCIGISMKGVDFKGPDIVHLVFLIAGPTQETESHVQLLAVISKLCTDPTFRKNLAAVTDPQKAVQLIKNQEERLSRNHPDKI